MAAPLSQDEIDALLGGGDDLDEPGSADIEDDLSDEPQRKQGLKNVGLPVTKPFRFKIVYRTPILKSDDYIFNPSSEEEFDKSSTVVRTLSNYSLYLKNQES